MNGTKINYNSTSTKLTEIKQTTEWLNEISSVALQQALRSQDAAFSNFFAKRAKYPNFKRKSNNQSFRLMGTAYRLKDGKLYIAKSKDPIASDGEKIKPLKALLKYQTKLAKLQRCLSQKVKESNNRNKDRHKVAKIHAKIADSRKDL